jgi:Tfp pilus assembly protein PilF
LEAALCGQSDRGSKAYESLRAGSYQDAIAQFQQALKASPANGAIHKDLAYTYLKIGENESARDQFAEAMKLDPADDHVALEYAFLCYETGERATARRVFDRVRKTGDAASRATAEQAFQNVDQPLAEGIARWSQAIELAPNDPSAHLELARLSEERDELALAAEHYRKAWQLRPTQRGLLLDLARVLVADGKTEEAKAALLAASRGSEPRVAEKAREQLPARYPYVYEFRAALQLDPANLDLWRELAYLLLIMGDKNAAEHEFRAIVAAHPEDLHSAAQLGFLLLERKQKAEAMAVLETVLKGKDENLAGRVRAIVNAEQTQAATMAERSLDAGYLKDALYYLTIASESSPIDYALMLKLGWTYNMLHQDAEALQWFDRARRSPDPKIAREAAMAYRNLTLPQERLRVTVWALPFYSSRWHDMFSYGQVKTDFKIGKLPLRPYLSLRFIGDTRGTAPAPVAWASPQFLSESSLIAGGGVATPAWHGLTGWAEAGMAINYLNSPGVNRAMPDYRGGISASKGFGHLLERPSGGFFTETTADNVFISRFQDDLLLYVQNRFGYTASPLKGLGGFQTQLLWNSNATTDLNRQAWANFVEFGPGVRWRWAAMPKGVSLSVNFLRGVYTRNEGNVQRPNFFDLRAGLWYAVTR